MSNKESGAKHRHLLSKFRSGGSMRLVKWLVIIALLILILLALFLPDRGLACAARQLFSDTECEAAVSSNDSIES